MDSDAALDFLILTIRRFSRTLVERVASYAHGIRVDLDSRELFPLRTFRIYRYWKGRSDQSADTQWQWDFKRA